MEVVALYVVFGSLISFILCLVGCVTSFMQCHESAHTVSHNATQTDAYQLPTSAARMQTDDVAVSLLVIPSCCQYGHTNGVHSAVYGCVWSKQVICLAHTHTHIYIYIFV